MLGCEAQGLLHRLGQGGDELGDAAGDLAVLIRAEPVGLAAGLDLHVGAELVDLLAGGGEVRDHDGLHRVPGEGLEAAAGQSSSVTSVTVRSMRRSGLSEP